MLRESRERSMKRQSSRNSFTHWAPDAALIGRMAVRGWDCYYGWWLGGGKVLLCGTGTDMEAMEVRLSG